MSQRTIQVVLPEETVEHMERFAAENNQTMAQFASAIVHRYVYPGDNIHPLPVSSATALEQLNALIDDQLWGVAYHRVPAYQEYSFRNLIEKRKTEPLTDDEEEDLIFLVQRFDKSMLLRSQALMLLHQRGHDVQSFFTPVG